MVQILLNIILPAFVVIGVGIYLGRMFKPDLTPINRVALYGAVPALVLTSLSNTDVELTSIGKLLVGNVLYLLAMGMLAWLASVRFPSPSRRGFLATSLFGNAANIMLPVTLFAFGEEGLQRALILYVFSASVMFTVAPIILSRSDHVDEQAIKKLLRSVFKLPVIWAALLGIAFNYFEISLPTGVQRGIDILGNAAIPLVLLTLGLQVERTGIRLPSGVNLSGTGFKLILGPIIGFTVARLLGMTGIDLAVLTLLAAMPPAVNNFMLALEFGGNAEEVAGTVILSTFTSFISLAAVIWGLTAYLNP